MTRALRAAPDDRPLVTANQVAERLHLSVYTIQEKARVGEIPAIKVGRHLRFAPADADRYIATRKPANS